MAETYIDRWEPAQFRNIEFLTNSHDAKGGRRLAVHEFPGAEEPLVEDLGGKAKGWSINAYFIGDDYDRAADALIAELNKPGADWLVHPWLGRVWVRALSWSRRETSSQNGYATVSIEFLPGGEQPATPTQDAVDTASARIGEFADASVGDFDLLAMSAGGMTSFVAAAQGKLELLRSAISLSSLPLTWSQQIVGLVGSLKTELSALAAVPGNYASALRGVTNLIGTGADGAGLAAVARPRLITRLASLAASADAGILDGVSLTDQTVRANLTTESALRGQLLLTGAMQVALADYSTENDRSAALAAIDAAYEVLLPTLADAPFQAAVSARAALFEAVMAQDLKPQQIRDIVSPAPSTVLAHRMQVDEATFLARNAVRHPLFVQGRVYG